MGMVRYGVIDSVSDFQFARRLCATGLSSGLYSALRERLLICYFLTWSPLSGCVGESPAISMGEVGLRLSFPSSYMYIFILT